MLSLELLAIIIVLLIQPLVAVLYVYVLYRLVAAYTAKRAEKAIDGRIRTVRREVDKLIPNNDK